MRRQRSTLLYLALLSCLCAAQWAPRAFAVASSPLRRNPEDVGAWWVGELKPAAILRSDKPRSKEDITLAIHYSHSRINVLEMECHLWPGIIAAAVYVPLANKTVHAPGKPDHGQHLSTVMRSLLGMYERLQKEKCVLDLGIFTEDLQELPEASYWARLPVNAMRNMALALAESDVVGIVDADFLIGHRGFVQSLGTEAEYAKVRALLRDERGVLVLPALEYDSKVESEVEGRNRTWRMATAADKRPVVGEFQAKTIIPFHHRYHYFTDYDRWAAATEPYEVYYPEVMSKDEVNAGRAHPYEPYILAWREHLPTPMWDERFRGYHLNKIQGLVYLHHLGFKFFIHPEGYVIHWPHPTVSHDAKMAEIFSEKSAKLEEIWDSELVSAVQATKPFVPVARAHGALHAMLH